MLTLEEARAAVLERVLCLPRELVALDAAAGRALAADVCSAVDHPAFDNSAMDGYAVRWSDVERVGAGAPIRLPVAMDIPAGADPGPLPLGHAARIMTGAKVPNGADTVIMREDTDETDPGAVVVRSVPDRGSGGNVRWMGDNLRAGVVALPAGTPIDAGAINLLATLGQTHIEVHRKPRVAVVSTGDELVPVGTRPGPGQIVNSNSHMLAALIRNGGGVPVVLPIARDTLEHTRTVLHEALAVADMVVTIGGVSVGDFDVVKPAMEELCESLTFWKVRMKPGKPLAFGVTRAGGLPLLGLPGHPVSSFVSFWQFVWPAMRKMLGMQSLTLPTVEACTTAAIHSPAERLDLQRGRLVHSLVSSTLCFEPHPRQGSDNPMSLVGIDGLARVPVGCSLLEPGARVVVERLPMY